jgi:hypothetical protein
MFKDVTFLRNKTNINGKHLKKLASKKYHVHKKYTISTILTTGSGGPYIVVISQPLDCNEVNLMC